MRKVHIILQEYNFKEIDAHLDHCCLRDALNVPIASVIDDAHPQMGPVVGYIFAINISLTRLHSINY